MAKRGLSLFLAILMLASVWGSPALAAEDGGTAEPAAEQTAAPEPPPEPEETPAPAPDVAQAGVPATQTPAAAAPESTADPEPTVIPEATAVPEVTDVPQTDEPAPTGEPAAPEAAAVPEEVTPVPAVPVEEPEPEPTPTPTPSALPVILTPAPEPTPEALDLSAVYINPLYADIVTEADLVQPDGLAVAAAARYASEEPICANLAEAGAFVREKMVERQTVVEVKLAAVSTLTSDDLHTIFDTAIAHTGKPTEGDYLRWQYAGWKVNNGDVLSYGSHYSIKYAITYYTDAAQESAVSNKIDTVLAGLGTAALDDYGKIRAIYDYICRNVSYDYSHLSDSSYKLQFTAYAALINGTAVCQGYANLLYRMALTAGVKDCRIITSYDHAWNIVKLGNVYYDLDSTWDDESTTGNWRYFLLCEEHFTDDPSHVREAPWNGASFYAQYPMASADYGGGALNAPQLTDVSLIPGGIQISWQAVPGAEKYYLMYARNGYWTQLATTTDTSYAWTGALSSGTNYSFTVCSLSADGSRKDGGHTVRSITYVEPPAINSVSAGENGITITWSITPGAEKYRVFYKTPGGDWQALADVTGESYTWTDAPAGAYSFTVRCVSSDGSYASLYDTAGKSIDYTPQATPAPTATPKPTELATPSISKVQTVSGGVKITWGKVTGAAKYRVFYKKGGTWTKIGETASTSYTWKNAKNGTKYTFTVRCISADGKKYTSAYDKTGKSFTYYTYVAPKLGKVSNTATGVKITWSKVTGAAKYRVFYKTGSGSWKKIGDTTAASYTWTKAKSGTKYSFTVRCVSKDGKTYTSAYDTKGLSVTFLSAPKIKKLENTASGVKITWGKVTGAVNYRVYYKNGGKWVKLGDTTKTSYTWTKAKSGKKYTFTVRCMSKDGKSFASSYDNTGKSVTFLSAPKGIKAVKVSGGVKITWSKVTGAAKYRVFYKTAGGKWTKIGDTTGASYTWKKAKSGVQYSFTVRCLSKDGKSYTSGYDSKGISFKK